MSAIGPLPPLPATHDQEAAEGGISLDQPAPGSWSVADGVEYDRDQGQLDQVCPYATEAGAGGSS